MFYLIVFILGCCIGSFIGAFSFRYPRGIPISKGRSFCPKCKKKISWYDNIPLLSFILLSGKCRNCKVKISYREPFIELFAGLTFLITSLGINLVSVNLEWSNSLFFLQLPFLFIVESFLITIFVIDLENQIIPDEIVFAGVLFTIIGFLITGRSDIFSYLMSGSLAALSLLVLHLLTKGRGMGLGDVKLALFIGMVIGFSNTIVWFFISFFIGGVFGAILIVLKKAKLKQKLPFAPFLIIGFLVVLFLGVNLKRYVYPWL
ncbi:MAG: prepilin peptidase [Candidatus Woesebacteria bacterium]|nr:MAG: prepilin peptidase [Candidatus Woesebacteria bacterium]